MKTRELLNNEKTPDDRLIAWGLKRAKAEERKKIFSTSAEPANLFFDYADSTVYNLANLATAAVPILHVAANLVLSVLNSIPWISVILSTLNGLLRIVRALIIKDVDPTKSHTFGNVGAHAKRVWLAMLGTAGISLGLASMFVSTLAMPLTIASTAVDTINNIVKFCESVKRCIFPNLEKNQTIAEARRIEVKRMFTRVENFVISATALTGTILLFTPLMPLGAGMLIGASVYALLDKYNLNPFKRIYGALKNKTDAPAEKKTEETVKPEVRAEANLAAEQKAEKNTKKATLPSTAAAPKKRTETLPIVNYQKNTSVLYRPERYNEGEAPILHQRASLSAR